MKRLSQSPTDAGFVQNPYPFYEKARDCGDFIFWEDYNLACATTSVAVNAVLKDRRLGRTPPPEKSPVINDRTAPFYDIEAHSMLELEPPRHTRLRGLVLRAFTSRRIAALGPEIEKLSHDLVGQFPVEPFDILDAYATKIPVIVIARLLGVPEDMADALLGWSHDMVGMYQAGRTPEMETAAGRSATEFSEFLRTYVEEKRKRPADDLITNLIAAEEDGEKLSTDELISTCILLLNAGHEATVHSLGNGIKAILQNGFDPRWTAPETVAPLVEEILRYDPPLHMFTRWTNEPVDICGHHFARGVEIAALLGSAARDPAANDAPDRFDPFRKNPGHISFGAGLHFCVGAPLARLEMQIALRVLFEIHPGLRLVGAPQFANAYHFHGLENLMVQV